MGVVWGHLDVSVQAFASSASRRRSAGGGGAIVYRATGAAATRGSSSTGTLTPALPAGTATDDLLLLLATSFLTTGSVAINTPSGWTLLATSATYDGGRWRTYLFQKIAGASETAPGLTTAAACWLDAQIMGFSGANTTTPIDAGGSAFESAASVDPVVVPSITTVTANAWRLFLTADSQTYIVNTPGSPVPSGWTLRSQSSGNASAWAMSSVLIATAGVAAATSFPRLGTGGGYVSIGLALRSA